jgi:serine/threonine-protein kinase
MPVGTAEADIKASLGEPAQESKGLWGDSRALLYPKYGSTGVSLGYIVDNASGVLQQTEITFPVGTDVAIIQQALEDLTPETIPPEVVDAVQQVYAGNQDIRTFTLDNHIGQIKRQPSGRLYLGLWNPDFHP